MRALRWVLTCTVLLAAGTAHGAEPVKIRASWIVAPSDWTPLLLEKPELMRHNGKCYAFEPMRFQGTPAVITALANNELELGNLAFSSLALAIQNAGLEDLRIVGDQFKDGTEGNYSNQFFVLKDSPVQKVEDLERQDRRDQCGRQRRRHRHARDAAQARARGQARLHPGRGAVSDHEGHAGAEESRSCVIRGAVLVRSRARADRTAAVQPARRARPHADDRVGGAQAASWRRTAPPWSISWRIRVRVVRWYLDPKNHDEAVQIAAEVTKLRPELFAGWLFTNKEYARSPDLLPDLAALQANIDVQRDLGFLKGPIDVQKYADLSIVREAAQRVK